MNTNDRYHVSAVSEAAVRRSVPAWWQVGAVLTWLLIQIVVAAGAAAIAEPTQSPAARRAPEPMRPTPAAAQVLMHEPVRAPLGGRL